MFEDTCDDAFKLPRSGIRRQGRFNAQYIDISTAALTCPNLCSHIYAVYYVYFEHTTACETVITRTNYFFKNASADISCESEEV